MQLDFVRKIAGDALERVPRNKDRCHEVARIFAKEFTKNGLDSKVYDGIAVYPKEYIISKAYGKESGIAEFKGKIVSVYHSWVELSNIVVDYHACGRFIKILGVVAIPRPKEERMITKVPSYYIKKIKKV